MKLKTNVWISNRYMVEIEIDLSRLLDYMDGAIDGKRVGEYFGDFLDQFQEEMFKKLRVPGLGYISEIIETINTDSELKSIIKEKMAGND